MSFASGFEIHPFFTARFSDVLYAGLHLVHQSPTHPSPTHAVAPGVRAWAWQVFVRQLG